MEKLKQKIAEAQKFLESPKVELRDFSIEDVKLLVNSRRSLFVRLKDA